MSMNIGGREYPVAGYVRSKEMGEVPLVDTPMLSDTKWHRLCLESRRKHPELYRSTGEDVEAVIASLEKQIEGGETA